MILTDEQIMRVVELAAGRVAELEQKQQSIDEELMDEIHELRNLLNTCKLELEKRRLKG